jgi:hypothetical protein
MILHAWQVVQAEEVVVFAAANLTNALDWMDYFQQRNFIQPETRKNLLGNRVSSSRPLRAA